jgi:hypothetical protein
MSEGGAYAHNLFAGKITNRPEPKRETPYHPAHSTALAGMVSIKGGDDRFYNNLFVGNGEAPEVSKPASKELQWISSFGLWGYDNRELPLQTGGNVYCHASQPYSKETTPVVQPDADPKVKVVEEGGQVTLHLNLGPELKQAVTTLVTTALLGKARIPNLPYEDADGSPLKIDSDYFGKKRNEANPSPGPFEAPGAGPLTLKVW